MAYIVPIPDDAAFAFDHRLYRSFFLVALVILVYDYLLTFATEIKYIWSSKPRLRLSTIWFLLIRYTGLAASVIASVFYFVHMSHTSCVRMQLVWEVLIMLQEALIECTIGLRVFAMYGLNLRILLGLAVMAGLAAGLAGWAIVTYGIPTLISPQGPLSLPGCHTAFPRVISLRLAGAWEAQIVYDTLVFMLTVRRAYIQRQTSPMWAGTLMERMFRDGGMYFGLIVLVNLGNLMTFYFGDVLLSGFLSWFTTSLSLTVLARLMLNLHEAGSVGVDTEEPNTLDLETLRFPTVPLTVDDEAAPPTAAVTLDEEALA